MDTAMSLEMNQEKREFILIDPRGLGEMGRAPLAFVELR
jgi:hypothetical protein